MILTVCGSSFQCRQTFRTDEQSDASGLPGGAFDQPRTIEIENHLVHCRRRDPEISLHVRLGGRPAVELRAGMNERQVLALPFGETGPGGVAWRNSLIHRCAQKKLNEALMNIRYRVELHQSERDELTALLAGGRQRVRRLKRAQILLLQHRDAHGGARKDHWVCRVWTGKRTKSVTSSISASPVPRLQR